MASDFFLFNFMWVKGLLMAYIWNNEINNTEMARTKSSAKPSATAKWVDGQWTGLGAGKKPMGLTSKVAIGTPADRVVIDLTRDEVDVPDDFPEQTGSASDPIVLF